VQVLNQVVSNESFSNKLQTLSSSLMFVKQLTCTHHQAWIEQIREQLIMLRHILQEAKLSYSDAMLLDPEDLSIFSWIVKDLHDMAKNFTHRDKPRNMVPYTKTLLAEL